MTKEDLNQIITACCGSIPLPSLAYLLGVDLEEIEMFYDGLSVSDRTFERLARFCNWSEAEQKYIRELLED